jgi:hypothetical protein
VVAVTDAPAVYSSAGAPLSVSVCRLGGRLRGHDIQLAAVGVLLTRRSVAAKRAQRGLPEDGMVSHGRSDREPMYLD